jgi:ribonucleoside-diphosphate reductase beta chain
MLLNFPRFNKMKGMGQIVTWSIRDESLHVESMIRIFRTLMEEYCHNDVATIRKFVQEQAKISVELEDCFIDLAFECGDVEGMTSQDVKNYIRFIADKRLEQLGFEPLYNLGDNPLGWLDWILNGVEHTNFFENRATEYAKGSLTGNWSEVWDLFDSQLDGQQILPSTDSMNPLNRGADSDARQDNLKLSA